ncbi:hypothetical protein GGS24DRAFT_510662 [Hypoxylon argillaceum]|nr:hypothetical protein GGS24DRAFT_510662 [Hypoxylon argillaceum]
MSTIKLGVFTTSSSSVYPSKHGKGVPIGQGKTYSGIFKLESHFELPNGGEYRIKGTAFAVSKFHALTSAHLMWHRKLGPAKWAVLIPDKRQHRSAERVKNCVAVACHANLIKSLEGKEQYAKKPSAFVDEEGLIIGFPIDMPDNNPGEHLILSTGLVSCTEENGVLSIEHRINTVEGNSGSPVIVSGKVVGIHSMFLEDQERNAAAPVNRNGNNIEEFMGVLRYRRGQHPKLPEGVEELGEATGVTHPRRVLSLLI